MYKRQPPYYACQWGTTSMLVCVGGLESDENGHTFTEEDPASPKRDIIKGLYVCGNVQGLSLIHISARDSYTGHGGQLLP